MRLERRGRCSIDQCVQGCEWMGSASTKRTRLSSPNVLPPSSLVATNYGGQDGAASSMRHHLTPHGSNPARIGVINMVDPGRAEIFALPALCRVVPFALSPVRPFALLPLIQPPIQLERSADQRHVSESLGKIPKLFGRWT